MKTIKRISLVLALVLLGFTFPAHAGISFTIGVGNYYSPVGDFDYLPLAFRVNPGFNPGPINFVTVMGQYGNWVQMQPFGQVWQPYAAYGWRPYTMGHWIYTQQYGPYWQGYEPWAWAAYHYGNWVFSAQFGWVWIPGYQWHPGQVAWSQGYDTIGWMPLPPAGYDYSRGQIGYVGPQNQFSYYDSDFGANPYVNGYINLGGPYYNPQYRNMYYNPSFLNVASNLFTFISVSNFTSDNYANYYLPPDYTQYIFNQRIVRINPRPPDRIVLERIVKQQIQTVPVEVHTIQTDKQPVKVVLPATDTALQEVRQHANTVVKEVIAPAFAQKQKSFKGEQAAHKQVIAKVFNEENVQPKVETVDSDQLIQTAKQEHEQRQQQRSRIAQEAKQKVERVVKEGKVRGPKNRPAEEGAGSKGRETEQPNVEQPQLEKPSPEGKPHGKPEATPGPTEREEKQTPNENQKEPGIENQPANPPGQSTMENQNNNGNAQVEEKQTGREKAKAKKAKKKNKNENQNNNSPE